MCSSDLEVKDLRSKKIPIVRILWRNAQVEEETWERETEMRKKYPNLFEQPGMEGETFFKKFQGRNSYLGEENVNTQKKNIYIYIYREREREREMIM